MLLIHSFPPKHDQEIYECCLAIETELGSYTYCAQITVENIPEEETTTFKLYVDPLGQSLVIDIPDDGLYKFFIYDTWGKPAYSNEVQLPGNSVYQIGLSNLPAGIYIVAVESALISERTKVMVPSF